MRQVIEGWTMPPASRPAPAGTTVEARPVLFHLLSLSDQFILFNVFATSPSGAAGRC
jgi:hypothetical protein